ncbi:FAD-dependent oxidoreductase [Amaricoccus solimangrovi]|uniref:FAD-dependent oxidoreductase n=1 Tax=Amaricoccus solimangrovi TaxID=2589815 RepID=UPI001AEEE7F4|nr:FAD-dependent oxidoreductase [Amaricoccus solimangrovi]
MARVERHKTCAAVALARDSLCPKKGRLCDLRVLLEAALTAAALRQFARLFGPEAVRPRATLYKDWASDPLTATPADWTSAGHPDGDLARVEGPWGGRLVLGGSEASPTEAGYLARAIEASRRAAAEVAGPLAERSD